ncbi:MAG TPA: phosphate ABC transporter ATP-binding protein PstB [Thermoanaerobaculales bacterium]|nr:phosphate ABC transporter ATP-binding protein PstB [Thermoanaerobaculales bacterium]HQL28725.1 phosphate ABC transporter ATP-binding protein PstB [Thermoanaerobaculales bacterium]HQN96775.1 phosphate ABC transporter ATP-binding protein PstB [Thermoanaerobaculales bacterium]HQP42927.1 phosphate ABC transporter ATP-binding protein PstB [Thermoanaerobaculales bacterium]
MSERTVALSSAGLHLYYGATHALKGITLELPERQISALIGPSGCGKSTFLRCFNRMNDMIEGVRTEGRVLVEGQDINRENVDLEQLRKRVGMVFQKSNPFPMSIRDNISYGPRMAGVRGRDRLDAIVERSLRQADLWVEVKDRLDGSALDLSGGQQQRLCIARALANEPEILLLDEPASALDPISTAKIEETLLQLRSRYTIVIVTHNLQQAARVADLTAFFMLGELVEVSDTTTMFTKPGQRITEEYITGRFG